MEPLGSVHSMSLCAAQGPHQTQGTQSWEAGQWGTLGPPAPTRLSAPSPSLHNLRIIKPHVAALLNKWHQAGLGLGLGYREHTGGRSLPLGLSVCGVFAKASMALQNHWHEQELKRTR